jgi:hypothetical protein
LYGIVAVQVSKYPTVLGLDDITGHCRSADKYLEMTKKALRNMEIEDSWNIIALMTDNPMVMQLYRGKFKFEYYWVLVHIISQCNIPMEYLIHICRYLCVFYMGLILSSEKLFPT